MPSNLDGLDLKAEYVVRQTWKAPWAAEALSRRPVPPRELARTHWTRRPGQTAMRRARQVGKRRRGVTIKCGPQSPPLDAAN